MQTENIALMLLFTNTQPVLKETNNLSGIITLQHLTVTLQFNAALQ